jgi:hypothetical protein
MKIKDVEGAVALLRAPSPCQLAQLRDPQKTGVRKPSPRIKSQLPSGEAF